MSLFLLNYGVFACFSGLITREIALPHTSQVSSYLDNSLALAAEWVVVAAVGEVGTVGRCYLCYKTSHL